MSEIPPSGLAVDESGINRCWWGAGPEIYRAYHDREWGRPVADDFHLFEKLCLEGFQSGLSWLTILKKRDNFREAFAGFDFSKVANFGEREVSRLLENAGIVRHRGKILSTINNAKRAGDLAEEYGTLARYLWSWEPGPEARPRRLTLATLRSLSRTETSVALSKDLKRRGWTFVGPTTVYAFMQAMGLVNDHLEGCHARPLVEKARTKFRRPEIGG